MKGFSCLAILFVLGCGSGGKKDEPGAADLPSSNAAASIRQRTNTDLIAATTQRMLSAGEVRVSLLVLPGDASVEVDKVPVRRRNGMVELVGNVGDELRVEVFLAANVTIERTVIIEATGVSPTLIDAEEESKSKIGPAKTPAVFNNDE